MNNFSKIDKSDVRTMEIGGKPEVMLNARGVLQLAYFGWADERLPKGEEAMRRYCQYISMRGYPGGASNALKRWKSVDVRDGVDWLKSTFARYVTNEADAMQYVMGGIL